MNLRLLVAPQAEDDLLEAFVWYEQRSAGLGWAFLESVERKLGVIHSARQIFRPRVGAYRLAATERFPYAIYFIWDESRGLVAVRRILHFKQDRHPRLGTGQT